MGTLHGLITFVWVLHICKVPCSSQGFISSKVSVRWSHFRPASLMDSSSHRPESCVFGISSCLVPSQRGHTLFSLANNSPSSWSCLSRNSCNQINNMWCEVYFTRIYAFFALHSHSRHRPVLRLVFLEHLEVNRQKRVFPFITVFFGTSCTFLVWFAMRKNLFLSWLLTITACVNRVRMRIQPYSASPLEGT